MIKSLSRQELEDAIDRLFMKIETIESDRDWWKEEHGKMKINYDLAQQRIVELEKELNKK